MAEKEKKSDSEVAYENLKQDSFRESLGLNILRSNRGDFGDLLYNAGEQRSYGILSSKEAQQTREAILGGRRTEAQENGYAGQMDVSNSDIAYQMYLTGKVSLQRAKIGDLEKLALENGAKLEAKVPEKFKDMSQAQIIEEAKKDPTKLKDGKLDLSKLSEDEQVALKLSDDLSKAYETSAAMGFMRYVNLYGDVNKTLKAVAEKYAEK